MVPDTIPHNASSSTLSAGWLAGSGGLEQEQHVHILLVEDDPVTQRLVSQLLKACDYEVTVARDGREALAVLESCGPVDLVLTDVIMPEMSGLELLDSLHRGPHRNVPVVVMSSRGGQDVVQQAFQAGAADYLLKPIRRNELSTLWRHIWKSHPSRLAAEGSQGRRAAAATAPAPCLPPAALAGSCLDIAPLDLRPPQGLAAPCSLGDALPGCLRKLAALGTLCVTAHSAASGSSDSDGATPLAVALRQSAASALSALSSLSAFTAIVPRPLLQQQQQQPSSSDVTVDCTAAEPRGGGGSSSSAPLSAILSAVQAAIQHRRQTQQQHHRVTSGGAPSPEFEARRRLAVERFRLKRKERTFDKKVRYESRKKLADSRLRVRGQFVRAELAAEYRAAMARGDEAAAAAVLRGGKAGAAPQAAPHAAEVAGEAARA